MDVNRDTSAIEVTGESEVVGMAVGDHDRLDITDAASSRCQPVVEVAQMPIEAGVDERDRLALSNGIEVHPVTAE